MADINIEPPPGKQKKSKPKEEKKKEKEEEVSQVSFWFLSQKKAS